MTGKTPKKKERPGVDRMGRTPLHYAALEGRLDEAKRLLAEGADASARDDNGWPRTRVSGRWSRFLTRVPRKRATRRDHEDRGVPVQRCYGQTMSLRLTVVVLSLAALAGCDAQLGQQEAAATKGDAGVAPDAGFVCTPPDGSTGTPQTFSGILFDTTRGCLVGTGLSLPVCGCFSGTGKDSSTWCFSAPDGTTYFTGSNDGCSVEMPPGWYATQTFGPSPFGTPSSAQEAACGKLFASSTSVTTGTYDRPGPPMCPLDGSAPLSDAAACAYPAGADTYGDASAIGCIPEPGGTRCGGFSVQHYLLDCSGGDSGVIWSAPMPDPSLGCKPVPVPVVNQQYYCCPCGS
jgi:hypothetical protein